MSFPFSGQVERLGYKALIVTVDAPRLGEPAWALTDCWAALPPNLLLHRGTAAQPAAAPYLPMSAGHREADEKNRYSLPPHLSMKVCVPVLGSMCCTVCQVGDGVSSVQSCFQEHLVIHPNGCPTFNLVIPALLL